MRGVEPVFVVVDDPDGHVVPSPGVLRVGGRVIGTLAHMSINGVGLERIATQMINMGPERTLELNAKRDMSMGIDYASDFPAPHPEQRKKARKPKQRLKGLRS